jgi:hypothetical protein
MSAVDVATEIRPFRVEIGDEALADLRRRTAHGGSAADAFDVVIPSMPGYGFSALQRGGTRGIQVFQPTALGEGRAL